MEPFLGEVKLFPWNWAPRGWALCEGQILPISQYTALFSLLGTTYGGNGTSTFALPDLQGRAAFHMGPAYVQGEKDGVETVTLNSTQIPAHSHAFLGSSGAATATAPSANILGTNAPAANPHYAADSAVVALVPTSIQSSGGNQPHDNMQPYLVLNYCIAMSGVYPSRN